MRKAGDVPSLAHLTTFFAPMASQSGRMAKSLSNINNNYYGNNNHSRQQHGSVQDWGG
jgi:hypothetical protein